MSIEKRKTIVNETTRNIFRQISQYYMLAYRLFNECNAGPAQFAIPVGLEPEVGAYDKCDQGDGSVVPLVEPR